MRAKCTDGMGLVDKEIKLVLVSQMDEGGQIGHGALHGVEALDDKQDFLPRPMSLGLALADTFA